MFAQVISGTVRFTRIAGMNQFFRHLAAEQPFDGLSQW
jgi:hypothetical protein